MDIDYKKHNLIFHDAITNYWKQVFVQPVLWILSSIIISAIRLVFPFNDLVLLILLFVAWRIVGFIKTEYPLFIIGGRRKNENSTSISAGLGITRVYGVFLSMSEQDNYYLLNVLNKKGLSSFSIPVNHIKYELLKLIETVLNEPSIANLNLLQILFNEAGYKTYIRESKEGGYYNLYAKKGIRFLRLRITTIIISLILCYLISFHFIK